MKTKILILFFIFSASMIYSQTFSGSFLVGGTSSSYYPVLFSVHGVNGVSSLGRLSIYIDDVHANGNWSGAFHFDIDFISSNWGNMPSKFIQITYIPGTNGSPYQDPIGDIADGSTEGGTSQLVVWLKGGATYQWSSTYNSRVTLIDGNSSGSTKTSASNTPLSMLTSQSDLIIKSKYNKYLKGVGLRTDGDGYFVGKVGIGTDTPQAKLQINAEGNPTNIEDNVNNGLTIKGTDQSLYMGVQSSTHVSYIQSVDYGTTVAPLLLNARGGNVGIGTNNPRNTLDVKGTIHAQEVKVDLSNWSDFVFEKDYKLPTLNEVNTYIENNGHLPDVPSAQEVKENGVSIAKIQAILLQKIEELTLYAIQQQKNILDLESQIQELKPAKK